MFDCVSNENKIFTILSQGFAAGTIFVTSPLRYRYVKKHFDMFGVPGMAQLYSDIDGAGAMIGEVFCFDRPASHRDHFRTRSILRCRSCKPVAA